MTETQEQREELRHALLGQLRYLVDEVEMLKEVIGRVPEKLLEGRPLEGDLSIKEFFGLLAVLDDEVYQPRIERMTGDEEPVFEAVDVNELAYEAGWNAHEMTELLERVQSARRALVEALEALPPEAWAQVGHFQEEDGTERRDIYELAHGITQHDAESLRAVSYRLHGSQMSSPVTDHSDEPGW